MQLIYGHYTQYFTRIAIDALRDEERLRKQISLLKPSGGKGTYKELLALHYQWISRFFTCLVFSAFTLESFINGYGVRRLTEDYYKKFLEKASIESKWMLVPKLITGQSIYNTKGHTLLKKLVKARNRLAHDKPKYKKTFDREDVETVMELYKGAEDISKQISAYECVETIIELYKRLKEIDTEAVIFELADSYLAASWAQISMESME